MSAYRLRLDERAIRNLVAGHVAHASIHHVDVEIIADLPPSKIVIAMIEGLADRLPHLDRPLDPPEAREFLPTKRERR